MNLRVPKEWMSIQNNAVRELNKTKGVPKKDVPPFQGWTPKVIPGGKKEGIESLLESGVVKKGVAPKTTKETLKAKKDRGILLRDADEDIARIKRENKQAIEDFKKKHGKKTVEDFRDEGDFDPGGMASGGRIAMAGGGALFKFIEKLFIKASNDIRLGRGKWKGLDEKQRIVQHDNLTKKVIEFQKSGKTVGLEEYFGVDPHTAFIAARDKVKRQGIIKDFPEVSGVDDLLKSDFNKAAGVVDERTMLKQKYPGLTDDLLEKILVDDNPQRKAEVLATMDEFLKLKEVGKSEEEAFKIVVDSFQKPTKHASGGLAYMLGEPTYMKAEGGQVGHGPWTTGQVSPQPQQQQQAPMHHAQGQPNPMKIPQGIPSAAPRSMDPRVMQQQMMQRAMMGQGRQGQPRVGMMYGGDPGFAFEYGGSWADWHDQHRNQMPVEDYIQTKLPKERLPFRDSAAGGGIIKALKNLLKKKPKKDVIKPFEFPDVGPQSDFFQKLLDDMLKSEARLKDFDPPKDRKPHEAGGRIGFGVGGFNKARRAFLKMMAGITGAGVAGGAGLLKLSTKAAPKVIKEAEVITRGADGMPKYIYDLIEVVKAKGTKDIIEGFKRSDYSTVHSYKGVEVIEEASGATRIKKGKETPLHGSDEPAYHEVEMEIIPGEYIQKGSTVSDDAAKAVKTNDEYVEYTARPDMDGKMKDIDEGIDDLDHLDLKKIADEIGDVYYEDVNITGKLKKTKKASGGRVPLGGGGILKGLKKITKKLKKIKKPEAYIMDKGYKLGKYYKKNPGKGLSHSTAVGTGVLISRHLDRQKRGKKASGGLAHMLGE